MDEYIHYKSGALSVLASLMTEFQILIQNIEYHSLESPVWSLDRV